MYIYYLISIIILFLIINYIENNTKLKFIHEIIIVLIYFIFNGGIATTLSLNTNYLYLIMLIVSMIEIFLLYYKELSSSRNPYSFYKYIVLSLIVYLFNECFLKKLDNIFLNLEELKILIWLFIIIYILKYSKVILFDKDNSITKLKKDYLLFSYVKIKNNYSHLTTKYKDLNNLIYSIIVYENYRRPKIIRNIDTICYRLDGLGRKFGIMQVWSNNYISDEDSIKKGIKKLTTLYKEMNSYKGDKKYIKILNKYNYNTKDIDIIMYIHHNIISFEK